MDWNLLTCGLVSHISYAPEEPGPRARLHATSAAGDAWRCLRCGMFVPGPPSASGPAGQAPLVRRGKELRSAFILRLFAVERFLRGLLVAFIAYAAWRFKYSRHTIEQAFNRELPVMRTLLNGLGYNVDHSKLVGLIKQAFTLDPKTLTWLALIGAGYALIEVLEAVGLWLLKRWGEYFAMVATSVGIPYEVYELTAKITVARVAFFSVNIALVVYLVLTKRLFGARGGKKAYEARLRGESIMDSALAELENPGPTGTQAAEIGANGADVPADVLANGADVPANGADLPADVPTNTADVPANGADVPANGADVPADVPTSTADVAAGRDVPVDVPADRTPRPA